LVRNGTKTLTICTRHGRFVFERVRLRDASGQEVCWLPKAQSAPWQGLCRWLVHRLSFDDCAFVCQRFQGESSKSADSLWRFVQEQAQKEDQQIAAQIEGAQARAFPICVPVTDVYAEAGEEFVVFTDGIGVKAQKPTREKVGQTPKPKTTKRHDTDVLQLPRPDGSYAYLCEGVRGQWSLVEAAHAFLCRTWSGACLSVVAITDGARCIREDMQALFGAGVRILLDWYHLSKRVYQDLSRAAPSKTLRKEWEQSVLAHLWRGRVEATLAFLAGVTPKNAEALSELIGYLTKHAHEIIDYERRQKAGRTIGSGQAEKAVDQVIGMRQKDRGMSWTKGGSRALALLKVAELKSRWLSTA
jgi:hypothetical protein